MILHKAKATESITGEFKKYHFQTINPTHPMNLTPAEDWAEQHLGHLSFPYITSKLDLEREITHRRQIQADALRWAAFIAAHSNESSQLLIRQLEHEANQLHPLPDNQNESHPR